MLGNPKSLGGAFAHNRSLTINTQFGINIAWGPSAEVAFDMAKYVAKWKPFE